MARRKKTSPGEDLIDLVSLLPWWAGVGLAILFYAVLHRLAVQEVAIPAHPGQMGTMVTQTLWKSLAIFGQYLLPLICVAGAAVSAWRRRQQVTLVANVTSGDAAQVIDGMSWREFEVLVGEAFRRQGYQVVETGGGGADGGVDLVLRKDRETFLVQCKQWKAFKVGVEVVRALYGVMAARGAAGGFVVTSGRFSREAVAFASGRNVRLIDGPVLHGLIKQARAAHSEATTPPAKTPQAMASTSASATPTCPLCSAAMVRRRAQRGANAGGEFWGCDAYPKCKGTRPA